jgi:hypothetical protein
MGNIASPYDELLLLTTASLHDLHICDLSSASYTKESMASRSVDSYVKFLSIIMKMKNYINVNEIRLLCNT